MRAPLLKGESASQSNDYSTSSSARIEANYRVRPSAPGRGERPYRIVGSLSIVYYGGHEGPIT